MGHNPKDSVYWQHYRNETSTVDYQGLRHGLDLQEVERMSSVFLTTGTANPPTTISNIGLARIYADPLFQERFNVMESARADLVRRHGSVRNAAKAEPEGYEAYARLRVSYHDRQAILKKAIFRKETQDYWIRRHNGELDDHDRTSTQTDDDGSRGQTSLQLSDVTINTDDDETDRMPIDPRLLLENLMKKDPTVIAEQQGEDGSNDETSDEEEEALDEGKEQGEDFDVVTEEHAAGEERRIGPIIRTPTTKRFIQPYSLVDAAATILFKQDNPPSTTSVTWKSLADYYVPNFNRLHRADLFYPGEEPLPGTFDCRYCGLNLRQLVRSHAHATHPSICHRKVLNEQQLIHLQERDSVAVETCPLRCFGSGQRLKTKGGRAFFKDAGDISEMTPCSYRMSPPAYGWQHFARFHLLVDKIPAHSDPAQNAYGDARLAATLNAPTMHGCWMHDNPLFFTSSLDYRMHLITEHRVHSNILRSIPSHAMPDDALTYFCTFCQGWVCRAQQLQKDHMDHHLASDVAQIVNDQGFFPDAEMFLASTGLRGLRCFCPFCLYDSGLESSVRLHTSTTVAVLSKHITLHLTRMQGSMPCPASRPTPEGLSTCNQTQPLNSAQLTEHLRIVHGMGKVAQLLVIGFDDVKIRQERRTTKKGPIIDDGEDTAEGEDTAATTDITIDSGTGVSAEAMDTGSPVNNQGGRVNTKRGGARGTRHPLAEVDANAPRIFERTPKRRK